MRPVRFLLDVDASDERLAKSLADGHVFVPPQSQDLTPLSEIAVELVSRDGEVFSFEARVLLANVDGVGLEVIGPVHQVPSTTSEQQSARPPAKNAQERVRQMSPTEALKRARKAERSERTALERRFGKAVWEGLLANPRISQPEIAGIAKKGTLPLPLLERIAANGTWLGSAMIRRAILTNPKLPSDAITRILRRLPKAELKLVPSQTVYPNLVRQQAKKLLRGA